MADSKLDNWENRYFTQREYIEDRIEHLKMKICDLRDEVARLDEIIERQDKELKLLRPLGIIWQK